MLDRLKKRSDLICSGLALIAFILWILSLFQARRANTNDMSALGLFSILPISFFVAFGLLVLSFFVTLQFVNKNRLVLLVCQTVLLILFLNLTPTIVETTGRIATGYANYRAVDYISQTGRINSSAQWIHNWPGFSILLSIFVQITSIPGQFILLTYPTFFNILLFAPLFVLFRTMSNESKMAWVAVWFVYFGNWVSQDYFSMQSLGLFAITLVLFLLFKNMNQGMRTRQWCVLFLLLFFCVTSSHVLSSLAILSVILALSLSKRLPRPILFVSLVMLVAGWSVFNASIYLSWNLVSFLKQILNVSLIFRTNVANRLTSGSASHILAADVRIVYSAAIITIAFLGIVLAWKNKRLGIVEKRVLMVLIGFSLLLFAFVYGGELFMRLYLFSLLPLAYFASKAILKYKYILFAAVLFFVVVAPSLYMIAHYGNETIAYTPPSEIVGVNFLFGTTTQGHIIGGTSRDGDFRDLTYRGNYSITGFAQIFRSNSSSDLWTNPQDLYEDRFVCISYETKTYYSWFVGDPSFVEAIQGNLTQSTSYSLVYSNPSFSIYYSRAKISP